MNWIYILLAAVFIISIFLARELFFTISIVLLQYLSRPVARILRLDRLPFVNIDKEFSNLFVILATSFFGFEYGFLIIGLTLMVHVLHIEVMDVRTIIDYGTKGALIVLLVAAFSNVSLLVLIPWVILVVKIFSVSYPALLFGSPIYSPGNIKELLVVVVYFGVTNLIELFV